MPLLCAHMGAHEARQQASTGWGDTQKWSLSLPPPVFLSCICFPSWRATQAACWHAETGVSSSSSYLFKNCPATTSVPTACRTPDRTQVAQGKGWAGLNLPPLHKECISQLNSSSPTYLHTNCKSQIFTLHTEYNECPFNYPRVSTFNTNTSAEKHQTVI